MESLQEFVSGKVYYQRHLLVSYGGFALAPGADATKQHDCPRVSCRGLDIRVDRVYLHNNSSMTSLTKQEIGNFEFFSFFILKGTLDPVGFVVE